MAFDVANIGKLAIKYYHKNREVTPFSPPPTFEFIVAYDFLNDAYLTIDFTWWTNAYSKNYNDSPFYTLEEALRILDECKAMMEKAKEELIEKAFFYDQVRNNLRDSKRTNYQHEMLHLSNAYYDTLRQKQDMINYMNSASTEEYKEMYRRELVATERGLRRLEKRFNFFFGDQAEHVKECIRAAGPYNSMKSGIKLLCENINKIEKHKQHLLRKAEKFKKFQEEHT